MTEIATDLGNQKIANIVSLGALIKAIPFVKKESIISVMKSKLTGKKAPMLDSNIMALEKGFAAVN